MSFDESRGALPLASAKFNKTFLVPFILLRNKLEYSESTKHLQPSLIFEDVSVRVDLNYEVCSKLFRISSIVLQNKSKFHKKHF